MRIVRDEPYGFRLMSRYKEVAGLYFGLSGLKFTVEFPSEWHEHRAGTVWLGLGVLRGHFSFPWYRAYEDHMQCSGPVFGFQFHEDMLWIKYGNPRGRRDDPCITIWMPWAWKHVRHTILTEKEAHPYRYRLRSGEIQERTATIRAEEREWRRWWLPSRKISRYIDIDFDVEVGERTGTWKGGTLGCGYEMRAGETPAETLRRMEQERKFT